ncbi:MAG: DegT/DnrJ/EryC1/StrS family aminotransferase, partial [Candidatus Obscuribacterales bacterium]|nr:DegT/DnrJ/EryC1/StrS family aminotransferase [Candidatus Obscuribacterales bacterium]
MNELPPTAGLPLEWQDFLSAFFAANDDAGFLSSLAKFVDVPELDIFSSGTLCLSIAFETLKRITGRSKVIIPAYTCPLVAIAARAAGVEVLLCDTQFGSTDMDLVALKELCDETVAAVVPTDIAGLPCDIDAVLPVAKAAGAYVVQDSAQALGATLDGKSVGSAADIVVFSLAIGKGLSLYDGGIIATRDDELRHEIRQTAKTRVLKNSMMNLLRTIELFGFMFLYNPAALPLVYGNPRRKWLDQGNLITAVGEDFDFDILS